MYSVLKIITTPNNIKVNNISCSSVETHVGWVLLATEKQSLAWTVFAVRKPRAWKASS